MCLYQWFKLPDDIYIYKKKLIASSRARREESRTSACLEGHNGYTLTKSFVSNFMCVGLSVLIQPTFMIIAGGTPLIYVSVSSTLALDILG